MPNISFSGNLSGNLLHSVQKIDEYGPYGYKPDLGGAIVFTVVFALCCLAFTYKGFKGRRWWLLATLAFGCFSEFAGNACRIYGHYKSDVVQPYIAQQVLLVLTPAFFAAAHFTILTKICQVFNDPSLIAPIKLSWLVPFFVIIDVISLAIQGAGSGLAAVSEKKDKSVSYINNLGDIVVGGLALQLLGYLAFNALFITFVVRATRKNSVLLTKEMKTFLIAVWTSALLIFGRSTFRLAEMSIGWIGYVATTEWYYLVFDASFVALAVLLLVIFSPVDYLPSLAPLSRRRKIHSSSDSEQDMEVKMGTPTGH